MIRRLFFMENVQDKNINTYKEEKKFYERVIGIICLISLAGGIVSNIRLYELNKVNKKLFYLGGSIVFHLIFCITALYYITKYIDGLKGKTNKPDVFYKGIL
jgi:hypothetical protein